MRWPWQRTVSADRLVVSWCAGALAYVQARQEAPGQFVISRLGVMRQGADSLEDYLTRVAALQLQGGEVFVMLRTEQYQLLQIDAPAVPPEELRQAARYQIRDMVDSHIDDLTIDVLKVGDGQQKGNASLYVVAAQNAVVRDVQAFCQGLQWKVNVIDIQDMAHRNLQWAVAQKGAQSAGAARAHAALIISGDRQALLTISANEELFYSRRLDLPDGFLEQDWSGSSQTAQAEQGYTPVDEYVPDYAGSGSTYDYGSPAAAVTGVAQDGAQRLLVEVQRSLDLWDRTWTALPLAGLSVSAGERSAELAAWLGQEMGQHVGTLDPALVFGEIAGAGEQSIQDAIYSLPLLGALLRTDAGNR